MDLYSPRLEELVNALSARDLYPGYYEVFMADITALTRLRGRMSDVRLAYHAEGLWITQPEFENDLLSRVTIERAASQARALQSAWLNHECAIKQMAGYSFGTYLPPLYTEPSADQTAENILLVQRHLDEQACDSVQPGPLFLLEMPPLTYFFAGSMAIPEYFARIARQVSCGFVLDIGHLWTVYRYTGAWRRHSLTAFTASFLEKFPTERIIEIHLAGLDWHEADGERDFTSVPQDASGLPCWIDMHGSPIPEMLFDMLEQVLDHPKLINLKGIALEVDTKSTGQILVEFEKFVRRFGGIWSSRWGAEPRSESGEVPWHSSSPTLRAHNPALEKEQLSHEYGRYAHIVIGQRSLCHESEEGLDHWEATLLPFYTHMYLPHEILRWGGDIREMFPETCRALDCASVDLAQFVTYWVREPRTGAILYDFFLLKMAWFLEFVREILPSAWALAEQEAEQLKIGYRDANQWDVLREV